MSARMVVLPSRPSLVGARTARHQRGRLRKCAAPGYRERARVRAALRPAARRLAGPFVRTASFAAARRSPGLRLIAARCACEASAGRARWFPSLAWTSPLPAKCASSRATASPAARIEAMDPATLRQLREQSGLRLDKEGRFWHRGGPVEHARTLAALHQGIHRAADGRWATRIGKDWAYLDVEDAALWLRLIEPSGASLRGQLASGEWVEIDPATLAAGADDALYARVAGERARLTRDAQLSLGEHLSEDGQHFLLQLGPRRFRLGEATGPEPAP